MDPTEEGTVADTVSDSMNPDFKKLKSILQQNQIRPKYSHYFLFNMDICWFLFPFAQIFFLMNGHIHYINDKL